MIQTEFYFNGNLIELADDSLVAMSYNVNDIAQIADRNADFSQIFKAPGTSRNHKALGFASEISSLTTSPYRFGDARIVQGGVTILPIGVAEIVGYEDSFYRIKVLAGNATFFRSLGSNKVSDLDLSAYDHTFNFATVTGSFGNDWTDGYKYPVINYGRFTAARNVRVDFLRHAFFAKTLVNEIFSGSGYTPAGDFLTSYEFERLLIPFTNDKLSAPNTNQIDFVYLHPMTGTGNINVFFSTGGRFNQNVGTARSYYGNNFEGNYKFRFSAHYENLSGVMPTVTIIGREAGVDQILDVFPFAQDDFVNGITTGVFTFEKEYHINAGTGFITELSININVPAAGFQIYGYPGGAFPVDPDSFFECYDAYDLISAYSFAVSAALNLPNITQVDFLKTIAQLYGIVYTTDSLNKIVYFQQFKKLYSNKPLALDWSKKIDIRTAKIEYQIGNYAQKNYLRWKVDSGDKEFIAQSADGLIPIDDTTLPESKDLVTLPFAATFEGYYLDGIRVPVIRKIKPPNVPDDPSFSIGTLPRLLYDFPVQASDVPGAGIVFTDNTSSVTPAGANPVPFCYFQYNQPFPGIGVTATTIVSLLKYQDLINYHYKELILMLIRVRLLKVDTVLDPTDIENLDHFIPIYLKQFTAYFYLNKVDRYVNDGRLTPTQLIRM